MKKVFFFIFCFLLVSVFADHDEPGSFREFELKEKRTELEINMAELLYQLTYVPRSAREQVYSEMQEIQQQWNEVIEELIEIDRKEHPTD